MKQLTKAGMLAIGAALVSQAAQAYNFKANDVYLGFTESSATSDYMIDLGNVSGIVGSTSVVTLTQDFSLSLFNSTFTLGANDINMGVVGGNGTFGSVDLYTTISGSTPSTDTTGYSSSSSTLSTGANRISSISPNLPEGGEGGLDSNKSWANKISPAFTASTYYGATGIDPNSAIDGSSGIVIEDLWQATPGNGYTYLGYFTLDTGNVDSQTSLTFTSINTVPEPGVTSIFAGGAALLSILRWRSVRKNA